MFPSKKQLDYVEVNQKWDILQVKKSCFIYQDSNSFGK